MTSLASTVQERVALPASYRGGAGPGPGGVTAADVLSMLRRRIVVLTALLVFFSGLFGGGFAIWWIYFPGYRSESLIECISNIPDTGLTLETERLRQEEHERFVATQALTIKSPAILETVLRLTEVRKTNWYKSVRQNEHLLELIDELVAVPVRGTNFLRVAMECHEPSDAPIIVNEIVREWYDTITRKSADEYAPNLNASKGEEEVMLLRIEEKRKELKNIAERLPPGARQNPAGNVTAQEVRQVAEQVALMKLELSQLEQYRAIYNDPRGVAATAEDRQIVEQDPQVAELTRNLFLLEQRLAADQRVFGQNHQVIRALDAQIAAMREKRAQREQEALQERQASIRDATNTAYENTRYALFLAQERLAAAEAALQDQDRLLFEFLNIEAELLKEDEYRQELSRYVRSLERVVRQRTAVNINVAQPAIRPLEKSSPSLLLIPLGAFLAVAFSLGITLSFELLDTSIRTSRDVVRYLDVAVLGAVPHADDEEVNIDQVETGVRDFPKSLMAEAYRRIRTNLQFSCPADRQRTVLVTSPVPEDGKTAVACNLAIALAEGGRRVLLVDANFRRPALHRVFSIRRAEGLSNLLIGQGSLESLVTATGTPRLDLLTSGPTPPNPAELLGGEHCRTLLKYVMTRYDQVILDTAPMLVASDAAVLAAGADGVVMVVRARENSRGVASRACQQLSDVGAHLFGVVLNAAQITRGGYFREQLRSYYDYQSDEDESSGRLPSA